MSVLIISLVIYSIKKKEEITLKHNTTELPNLPRYKVTVVLLTFSMLKYDFLVHIYFGSFV